MKHYQKEFKEKIAVLHMEGRTITSLSAEYGISASAISNWTKAYRKECQENEEGSTKLELCEKVKKLQRDKAELEKEVEFLKKVAAFFTKEID